MRSRQRAVSSRLTRAVVLLASVLWVAGANSAQPTGPAVATDALRHGIHPGANHPLHPHQPLASQAGSDAVRESKTLSPARLLERAGLLASGEVALARLDAAAAQSAFERAALILHAADTEIALVRAYMQAGDYRRALTFVAHTAGAHLDVAEGSLLYAWLLQVGGQPALAQRLLADVSARLPNDTLAQSVQQQLRSGAPIAADKLLTPPLRLAPYGDSKGLLNTTRVVGSAVLLRDGASALMPLNLLPRSGRLWLRNGLGKLVKARLHKRLPGTGVALLRLERALPVAGEFSVVARDAFAGSAGFAVEYVSSAHATPAWPVLRAGFLGGAAGNANQRLLGIEMPAGARGGPVFDAAGQLTGLALPGGKGQADDRLVPASQLTKALGPTLAGRLLGVSDPTLLAGSRTRASVDAVYEASLKTTLQVITAP